MTADDSDNLPSRSEIIPEKKDKRPTLTLKAPSAHLTSSSSAMAIDSEFLKTFFKKRIHSEISALKQMRPPSSTARSTTHQKQNIQPSPPSPKQKKEKEKTELRDLDENWLAMLKKRKELHSEVESLQQSSSSPTRENSRGKAKSLMGMTSTRLQTSSTFKHSDNERTSREMIYTSTDARVTTTQNSCDK